ncbi:MAG TPA: class IV adenylate cyclase [Pyrinomonadaceae bacterium]|nr:class IV adenylate cyclase [Pyrinomonadaceae bacterium]
MATEIEKKYRLGEGDADRIAAALEEFGAEPKGEDEEENIIFSSPDLAGKSAIVRIRRVGDRTVLTFKRRLPGLSDLKQQIEFETGVADSEAMSQILKSLGLEPVLVYEKRRRKWQFRSAEVVIDLLPFGLFMEIEGSVTAIKEAEMLLEADLLEPVAETYPRLTAIHGNRIDGRIESRFTE